MANIKVNLMGRIDELDELSNPTLLKEVLEQNREGGTWPKTLEEEVAELLPMYNSLNLPSGIYMVTGIEGKNYGGYNGPDIPWPLQVEPSMSIFDIMVLVSNSEYNGYPDINHVWFEYVTVDVEARTIQFSMGS